jgi:hypothetical protein
MGQKRKKHDAHGIWWGIVQQPEEVQTRKLQKHASENIWSLMKKFKLLPFFVQEMCPGKQDKK